MEDRFERRALLLHLGDVLEAVNCLLKSGRDDRSVHERAAKNDSLASFPLLKHVSPRMTSEEFVRRAIDAFVEWPRELLEPEVNRERLASEVQRSLFAGNAEGWGAYVAAMRDEVPWFAVGLQSVSAGGGEHREATEGALEDLQRDEAASEGDVERNGGQREDQRESVESAERFYPSWPWKAEV